MARRRPVVSGQRPLARSLRLGMFVAAILGVVTGIFAWRQVQNERSAPG
jgi:hypothetical protein